MVVFGAVHALLLWFGDIVGAYGLLAVLEGCGVALLGEPHALLGQPEELLVVGREGVGRDRAEPLAHPVEVLARGLEPVRGQSALRVELGT